jgi:hypothetical protein
MTLVWDLIAAAFGEDPDAVTDDELFRASPKLGSPELDTLTQQINLIMEEWRSSTASGGEAGTTPGLLATADLERALQTQEPGSPLQQRLLLALLYVLSGGGSAGTGGVMAALVAASLADAGPQGGQRFLLQGLPALDARSVRWSVAHDRVTMQRDHPVNVLSF